MIDWEPPHTQHELRHQGAQLGGGARPRLRPVAAYRVICNCLLILY
jgi:hypothetical protein